MMSIYGDEIYMLQLLPQTARGDTANFFRENLQASDGRCDSGRFSIDSQYIK